MMSVNMYYALVLLIGARVLVIGEKNFVGRGPARERNKIIAFNDCENNVTRSINLNAVPSHVVLTRDTNRYLLYTRNSPQQAQSLFENQVSSVKESHFNPADQTVVILHGWSQDSRSPLNLKIRNAFLGVVYANVIVVDWSSVASSEYVTAAKTATRVGRFLGRFLQFLNRKGGAPYGTMHLVGHGLGAHVAGSAAQSLQPSGLIARITGLDPAGLFVSNSSGQLQPSDAAYVEAIHTDGDMLGSRALFGHVDFYPNGGVAQPGCPTNESSSCSHVRAWQLFAASVRYNHLAGRRCATKDALRLDMCYQDYLALGNDDLLKNGSGIYRLTTESTYPYKQKL